MLRRRVAGGVEALFLSASTAAAAAAEADAEASEEEDALEFADPDLFDTCSDRSLCSSDEHSACRASRSASSSARSGAPKGE